MATASQSPSSAPAATTPPIPSPTSAAAAAAVTSSASPTTAAAAKTLPTKTTQRGLNKPKCIKCGNVARSRCPYQSCKSCCSKAQNPCHIHVLKPNATLADRSASNATPEQQTNEAPSPGPPQKGGSLRQLSTNFAQFNNVNTPARPRKPLTRKDAVAINEWRFSKLKEYKESQIEAENEAFDRYMQNTHLLEEVFTSSSKDSVVSNLPAPLKDTTDTTLLLKAKLRSNPFRTTNLRKRIKQCVNQGLKKLKKQNIEYGISELHHGAELDQAPKSAVKELDGKSLTYQELNDKLNKARNQEDLKSCLQILSSLTSSRNEAEKSTALAEQIDKNNAGGKHVSDTSVLKLVKAHEVDQDTINSMDVYFSSLEEIEDL
ncbi:hypothetical protein Drorol1_Dr00025700 [Drosera rotundifolia]